MSENNGQSKKDILKDLNAVKTGGKFLTRVVGTNDVFCKESFLRQIFEFYTNANAKKM